MNDKILCDDLKIVEIQSTIKSKKIGLGNCNKKVC